MGACASRQKVAGNPAGADGPARPPATRRGSVSAEADAAPPGAPSAAPPPSPAARARLEAALAAVPFLAGLDAAARADVAAAMRERRVAAGEVVIREGEEGDFFYLVASGRFAASVAGAPAREYAGAGHFGELALLHDCPRAATVACVAPGALWALGRADFRRAAVGAAGARRTAREALLRAAPAFAGLAPGRLAAVADCLAEVEFPPGAQVLAQGAPAGDDARFFVVEGGAVRCFRTGADGVRALTRDLGPSECFGEVALLGAPARQADVVAGPAGARCLAMERAAFARLLGPAAAALAARAADYARANAEADAAGRAAARGGGLRSHAVPSEASQG